MSSPRWSRTAALSCLGRSLASRGRRASLYVSGTRSGALVNVFAARTANFTTPLAQELQDWPLKPRDRTNRFLQANWLRNRRIRPSRPRCHRGFLSRPRRRESEVLGPTRHQSDVLGRDTGPFRPLGLAMPRAPPAETWRRTTPRRRRAKQTTLTRAPHTRGGPSAGPPAASSTRTATRTALPARTRARGN